MLIATCAVGTRHWGSQRKPTMASTLSSVSSDTLTARRLAASFFIPLVHEAQLPVQGDARVCAIVPTRMPTALTVRLVRELTAFNPNLEVIVVDDCSSQSDEQIVKIFREIASYSRVRVTRTPVNKLKAGALNHALSYFTERDEVYDVILTLDDDVVVAEGTVRALVEELMQHPRLGAMCSQCRVLNKNKNILTRLQGLEYVNFNAIRLADEGFMRGPLVMHGMLTAFRASALYAVGGFEEGHLIEDYEITARLKSAGWHVRSSVQAPAWTVVPETLSRLWRQRTRWSYGGITVVARARSPLSVFQDLLGHSAFIAMLCLVAALNVTSGLGEVPLFIAQAIISLSLAQLGISYTFQLWLMRTYVEKDKWDWLIRLLLIPEFVYSYLMTLALLGSYVFHSFVVLKRHIITNAAYLALGVVERGFRKLGYAETQWGTQRV